MNNLIVDKYLSRSFDMADYNCWDFVRDVWLDITGIDIGHRTPNPPTAIAMRRRFDKEENQFQRLESPETPCIVLMRQLKGVPHVGIFSNGRILSLDKRGVTYLPLDIATYSFKNVRFYK